MLAADEFLGGFDRDRRIATIGICTDSLAEFFVQRRAADENDVVEAWHDHAMPGWRSLPILPESLRLKQQTGETSQRGQAWLDRYPEAWQFEGAPIRTERPERATRHIAGRSPWGGFVRPPVFRSICSVSAFDNGSASGG